MNRLRTIIIFLSLFAANLLFAQTMPVSVSLQPLSVASNHRIYTVKFQLPADSRSGLILSLDEAVANLSLIHCRLENKELWLKKTSEPPANRQVVHWSVKQGDLILRFNEGILTKGQKLSVAFAGFQPTKKQGKIWVYALTSKGLVAAKGALLGAQTFSVQAGK